MMYELELTRQYLKDLKLARKRGLDESKLNEVILKLVSGEEHVTVRIITLVRTGTHADLF